MNEELRFVLLSNVWEEIQDIREELWKEREFITYNHSLLVACETFMENLEDYLDSNVDEDHIDEARDLIIGKINSFINQAPSVTEDITYH